VTAPQIISRKTLTFPKNARNDRPNSFSDSVRVGYGEFSNIVSTALAMRGTSCGVAARIMYVPTESREESPAGKSSVRYSRWKMRHSELGGCAKIVAMVISSVTG